MTTFATTPYAGGRGGDRPGFYGDVPVEKDAPPSTYAIAAVLSREQGAWLRFIGVTALRTATIVPGVYIASKTFVKGVSIWQVILISTFASTTISFGMLGWYWLRKKAAQEESAMRTFYERARGAFSAQPAPTPPAPPPNGAPS